MLDFKRSSIELSQLEDLDVPTRALDNLNSLTNIDYVSSVEPVNLQYSYNCGVFSRDKVEFVASSCNSLLVPGTATA